MIRFLLLLFWLSVSSTVFGSVNFIVADAMKQGFLFGYDLSTPWVRFFAVLMSLTPGVLLILLLVGMQKSGVVPWFDILTCSVGWIDESSPLFRLPIIFALLAPVMAIASWVFLATFYELQLLFGSVWLAQFGVYVTRIVGIAVLGYLGVKLFNENIVATTGGVVSLLLLLLSPIPYYIFKMPTKEVLQAVSAFWGRLF